MSFHQNLEILDWGKRDYEEALSGQRMMVEERIAGVAADRLVLVEHPPMITIGRSGSLADLRTCEAVFRQKGIPVVKIERGGKATFHGPGQLVAYPIIKVEHNDLHHYLKTLLEVTADVLLSYGFRPLFKKGQPGIWINSSKIASVGIAVRKWVTFHGVALNVNTNIMGFNCIIPCGQPDETITSMHREAGKYLAMAEVKDRFINAFIRRFNYADSLDHRLSFYKIRQRGVKKNGADE